MEFTKNAKKANNALKISNQEILAVYSPFTNIVLWIAFKNTAHR